MRDAKMAILEDQLDTLAGRLADAEERFELLLEVLTTGQVPKKLGITGKDIKSRCEVPMPEYRRWKHEEERRRRLAKAELDDFRRRVADAESVAGRPGESFSAVLKAAQGGAGGSDTSSRPPLTSRREPTVWDQVLAHLETVVNRYSFITWLQDTSLVRDDGETLVVRTADRMGAAWLEKQYAEVISEALSSLGRPGTSVTFVVGEAEKD